ncbi:hypothetical protein GTA08_BOTSDO01371 [Botryosphaeria dothidea]|uniref:Uncharacterized protein n=1 Tax=Botryosphaeria dothidea TaxID=55169 RepID=A0A8H4N9T4_9PEZI|nr:hypothetical protein GTA08_BOTSDO01371 [Botryosphaeria dothidea]
MIPYGQSGGLLSSDQASYAVDNPWGFKPPSWPAFAEYSEPPVQADVMIDTGFVVRAFLPYTLAQDRQSVGNFSGRATIIAARVACSQPTFSNLNLTIARDLGDQSFGVIKGDLELGEVPFEAMGGCTRRPCRGSQENPKKFECTLNFGDDRSTYPRSQHEWASTLCRVDEFKEQLMFSHKNGSYLGPGYLLLNVSQPAAWWWNIGKANNQSITDFDVSGDRFCTHLDTDTSYSVRLSATLCYYNPGPVQYDVAMQSNTGRIEPTVGWDAKQGQYDTGEVRKQLGVTENRLGYGDRGVLKLIKERDWPMYELKSMDLLGEPPSQNFALCQFCQRSNSTIAHRALAALFQDVLVETGNPALALQALFTTISQMTYYSLLVEFDQDGPAQVISAFANPISTPSATATAPATSDTAIALSILVVLFIFVLCCGVAGAFYVTNSCHRNNLRPQNPDISIMPNPPEPCSCTRRSASTTYGIAPFFATGKGGTSPEVPIDVVAEQQKMQSRFQLLEQKIGLNDFAVGKLRSDLGKSCDELRAEMHHESANMHAFVRKLVRDIVVDGSTTFGAITNDTLYDADKPEIGDSSLLTLGKRLDPPPGQPGAYPIPNPNPPPTGRAAAPPVPPRSEKRHSGKAGKFGGGCKPFPPCSPLHGPLEIGQPIICACAATIPQKELPPLTPKTEGEKAGKHGTISTSPFTCVYCEPSSYEGWGVTPRKSYVHGGEDGPSVAAYFALADKETGFISDPETWARPERRHRSNSFCDYVEQRRHRFRSPPETPHQPERRTQSLPDRLRDSRRVSSSELPSTPSRFRMGEVDIGDPSLPPRDALRSQPRGFPESLSMTPPSWLHQRVPVQRHVLRPRHERPAVEHEDGYGGMINLNFDIRASDYVESDVEGQNADGRSQETAGCEVEDPSEMPGEHRSVFNEPSTPGEHSEGNQDAPRRPIQRPRSFLDRHDIEGLTAIMLLDPFIHESYPRHVVEAISYEQSSFLWKRFLMRAMRPATPRRRRWMSRREIQREITLSLINVNVRITLHPLGNCVFEGVGDPVEDHITGRRDCIPPWERSEILASPQRLNERKGGIDDWERFERFQRMVNVDPDVADRLRKITESTKKRRLRRAEDRHRSEERFRHEEDRRHRSERERSPPAVSGQSDDERNPRFMMSGGRDGLSGPSESEMSEA